MAKKSAKSKGYRKQKGKKAYLSKRDIVMLCILLVALAVASVLLFRYDDGALKMKDGAVVTDGDNWLVVNGSNTRGGQRYYKLGEIGELEGYSREAMPGTSNPNVSEYVFSAEDDAIETVTVSTSHASAKALCDYTADSLATLAGVEVGPVQTAKLGGREASYFFYHTAPAEAEEAEAAEAKEAEEAPADAGSDEAAEAEQPAEPEGDADAPYHSAVYGAIDAGHKSCVVFRLDGGADSADACPGEDALLAMLEKAIGAVALEEE